MKKLMFATALVASAAAFADPINAISFEGYQAGFQFTNGQAEKKESPAGNGGDKSFGPYFLYFGDQDGSSVKAFGGDNPSAPAITRPLAFANASPNANYLDLSTEGGILWRSINGTTQDGGTNILGSAETVAADGLYLDTLVQFTPTEDGGTPELTDEDKLAIWLNVDSTTTPSTTNLMVRAKYYAIGALGPEGEATSFVLAPTGGVKNVVAGEWYRLTVKAIANVMSSSANGVIPAFEIYIDGMPMCATTAQFSSQMAESLVGGMVSDSTKPLINGNRLFPSLAEMGGSSAVATLTAVGFKGSGALDDIVWTTEDPFAGGSGGDYQVTIGDAVVPITLSAEDVTALGTALFDAGITGTDLTTPAGVNAALAGTIGSSGIPVWQAFFLGLPLTEDGLESFKITSISFDEDGKVVVTVPASVTLLTGRGVDIVLSLQGSGDLSSWSEVETATITNDKPSFAPVTPGGSDTKKFYKIVVSFGQTPVVQGS